MLSNGKEKPVLDVEPKINFGIRTAVLVLLCCQNAGHALLTRYSQGHHHHHSHSIHAIYLRTVLQATTKCNGLSKMATSRCLERNLLEYWSSSCRRDYQTHLFRLSRSGRSIRNWWAHSLVPISIWLQLWRRSSFDKSVIFTSSLYLLTVTHCRCIRNRLIQASMASITLKENYYSCYTLQVLRSSTCSSLYLITSLHYSELMYH